MSKQQKPTAQTPKIEIRPVAQKAYMAAYEVRNGLKSYNEYRADVMQRLAEMPEQIERNARYGTISEQAGQVVTLVSRAAENMRLDLLVKYAARAEVGQATLDCLMDLLTDEERASVRRILGEE